MSDDFFPTDPWRFPAITAEEYVAELQRLIAEHGPGLIVKKWMPARGVHNAALPRLGHTVVKPVMKGVRQIPQQTTFFQEGYNAADERGVPVIRV
jgi:hypothetical protein